MRERIQNKLETDVQGQGKERKVIYRILNFISCTAMLSQKPSMANLEAV